MYITPREKCPNTESFWSVFSHIWTEYGDLLSKSPNSVQIRENADQKNSVFRYFLRSVADKVIKSIGILRKLQMILPRRL